MPPCGKFLYSGNDWPLISLLRTDVDGGQVSRTQALDTFWGKSGKDLAEAKEKEWLFWNCQSEFKEIVNTF